MSSRRPRLVASDLDGTLLRRDGTVSVRNRAALAAVEAAGVPLVLVTGRPPRWMPPVVEQTGHRGIAVCANGAVVYDLHTARVLSADCLSVEPARAFTDRLRSALPGVHFAVEGPTGQFGQEPDYTPRLAPPVERRVAPAADLVASPTVKLLVRHDSFDADDLLAAALPLARDLPLELTHSSRDGLLEVSAAGVTKATALARLAGRQGVEATDVIAFGDMPNDVPVLVWAGWGVAVGDAHPSVLAAADEVAPPCAADGVASVLERYFS